VLTLFSYLDRVRKAKNITRTCVSRFQQQVYELSAGKLTWYSFNPRAKFIACVMSNCEHKECTNTSRCVLNDPWLNEVTKATVIFLKLNEHGGNNLRRTTTDLVQGTWLEMKLGTIMRILMDAI
jgi:hypothetical protein